MEGKWTSIINSKSKWYDIDIKRIWQYRELIWLFVKRDFVTAYAQTAIGPFWHLLQPLLTSFAFAFAFAYIGRISTGQIPPVLYYMSGMIPWGYFSDCTFRSSNILRANSGLYGKVYFPRLVTPIYIAISSVFRFLIQMIMFLMIWGYFLKNSYAIVPNGHLLLLPVLMFIMSALGIGIGLFVSSVTVRYRDLANLVGFGVQVLMYLSPVIFPVNLWPEHLSWIIHYNPMTPVIVTFRSGFLGDGNVSAFFLTYSLVVSLLVLLVGIVAFNKAEKDFIDIV